jgi:hypothetical protein
MPVSATQKLLLLRLADYVSHYEALEAEASGDAWSPVVYASVRSLEMDCGLSRHTVINGLEQLIAAGHLRVVEGGIGRRARRYQIRRSGADSTPLQSATGADSTPLDRSGADSTPLPVTPLGADPVAVYSQPVAVYPDPRSGAVTPRSGADLHQSGVLESGVQERGVQERGADANAPASPTAFSLAPDAAHDDHPPNPDDAARQALERLVARRELHVGTEDREAIALVVAESTAPDLAAAERRVRAWKTAGATFARRLAARRLEAV